MSISIHTSDSDVQEVNWNSLFNHAYANSDQLEAGDAVSLACLSDSVNSVLAIKSGGRASRTVQRATRNNDLRQVEAGYKIVQDAPDTSDLRQSLRTRFLETIRNKQNAVIRAPTSTGKTHVASTTNWRDLPEITGGEPVIHLSGTTDARDAAIKKSENSSAVADQLLGRKDACGLVRGDFDSGKDAISAPDGSTPSEWFETMCKDRGLPLSFAHGQFRRLYDSDIPCESDGHICKAESQWDGTPRMEDGKCEFDVLHATHQFAKVPQLIEDSNLIIDERPDFSVSMNTGKIRESVTSYLQEIDSEIERWSDLTVCLRKNALPDDFAQTLVKPDRDWFTQNPKAHALAPGIAQAIATAEERSDKRWMGEAKYKYPKLIPGESSNDHELTIRIVFDESNEVRILQSIPDLSKARCVIGFDAHPAMTLWEANTGLSIQEANLITESERQDWRRNERGLQIVQVGDNKNTWTRNVSSPKKVELLAEELRIQLDSSLATGVTSKEFHKELQEFLAKAGAKSPKTLYYGNEKSLEDFADEKVGLVAGCISPSSDHIKDWVALLDKTAVPRREVDDDYQGQEWVGPDRQIAEEILADVREYGVLQACGRYARSPQDDDSGAVVYVQTNVLPDAYVDEKIGNVYVFGSKAKKIVDYAESHGWVRAKEIAEELDVSKKYALSTLEKCREYSWMHHREVGPQSAFEYKADRSPDGIVDMS